MQLPLGLDDRTAVLTVSELNRRLRGTLEAAYSAVWVAGEISNLRVPSSGHLYFRLKDEQSQIAAVMFRTARRGLAFRPADGLDVIVQGRVSLYPERGDLQIYVDSMEPRGLGGVQLALQQLKEKLAAEGLFAGERKRPLPFLPAAVGVITALTGAAVRDIIATLRRRLPGVRIVVRPVRVQGRGAGAEVVAALRDLAELGAADVVIVGRGGGSIEDLWAFNEEAVVRAIARCPVPVVSAVGHETDVTLADLVADVRAPTPTAAAELVTPDGAALRAAVARLDAGLLGAAARALRRQRQRFAATSARLRDPRRRIQEQRLSIDDLAERARRAAQATLRLAGQRCRGGGERLHALSPLAVLQRGYAIAHTLPEHGVVRTAAELQVGQSLELRLGRGRARVRVEEREVEEESTP
jgi:exodeoxyribonuclease VII large subunit